METGYNSGGDDFLDQIWESAVSIRVGCELGVHLFVEGDRRSLVIVAFQVPFGMVWEELPGILSTQSTNFELTAPGETFGDKSR